MIQRFRARPGDTGSAPVKSKTLSSAAGDLLSLITEWRMWLGRACLSYWLKARTSLLFSWCYLCANTVPHWPYEKEQKGHSAVDFSLSFPCTATHTHTHLHTTPTHPYTHLHITHPHTQDYSCLRTLLQLIHHRRRLLRHVQRTDTDTFQLLLQELSLKAPKTDKYSKRTKKKAN